MSMRNLLKTVPYVSENEPIQRGFFRRGTGTDADGGDGADLCVLQSVCDLLGRGYDADVSDLVPVSAGTAAGRETDVQERATELGEYCPYREDLIEQVQLVFEKAHLNMAWYNRLQENRDVIAQQLDAMAYIMEDCANEETDVTAKEGKITASMRYAWKELGVLVEQLRILENSHGKWQVLFQGRTRGSKCISVREMARLISGVSGRGFAPAKDSKALLGTESQSLIFCENSRLTAGYGVARAVREDEQVSGDNFSFQMLDNGCCVMAVSDGMGSGYAACKESEMVID